MTTPPDGDLRTRMHRVADEVTPIPLAADLWQRGVAARRRGQAVLATAVVTLVVSVVGTATLLGQEDREARTASGAVVERGAIPSTIVDPADPTVETDLALGPASVAFVSDGRPVVVTARDGVYHAPDLESFDGGLASVSPDGQHLAWTWRGTLDGEDLRGVAVLDLVAGGWWKAATVDGEGSPVEAKQLSWAPGSQWLTWASDRAVGRMPVGRGEVETHGSDDELLWTAIDDAGTVSYGNAYPFEWAVGLTPEPKDVDGEQLAWGGNPAGRIDGAVASPTGNTVALATSERLPAADFLTSRRFEERALAPDLYPDGAAVRPLGWATDTLVLAQVDAPAGSYVEGSHLALLTAPNTPEERWTYRVVVRDVPSQAISVAVDLVPELDGTPSQQLTYDFPVPAERDISWLIGLGVAAAIAVLMALRWLWRRLRGR